MHSLNKHLPGPAKHFETVLIATDVMAKTRMFSFFVWALEYIGEWPN